MSKLSNFFLLIFVHITDRNENWDKITKMHVTLELLYIY